METTPKVHRSRHRRSDSRHRRQERERERERDRDRDRDRERERERDQVIEPETSTTISESHTQLNDEVQITIRRAANILDAEAGGSFSTITSTMPPTITTTTTTTEMGNPLFTTRFTEQHERQPPHEDAVTLNDEEENPTRPIHVGTIDTVSGTKCHDPKSPAIQRPTMVLVNGHAPSSILPPPPPTTTATTTTATAIAVSPVQEFRHEEKTENGNNDDATASMMTSTRHKTADEDAIELSGCAVESPSGQLDVDPQGHKNPVSAEGSSRNSSGDALSLRETLQQLPATMAGYHHHHHHHHHHRRRNQSPQSPLRRGQEKSSTGAGTNAAEVSCQRGILGFMDRELKQSSPTPSALSASGGSGGGVAGNYTGSGTVTGSGTGGRKMQSLSDPQASPAQRSVRSRSSIEKSPRRKRSKSESRRRRERKLIAAGEMEVRQANETLMRYLKQCSEMNDASLSGELEIDQSFEERRVHRKTKSQRDKRGLSAISKLYTAGGLSSLLKELSEDIVPAEGEEIYNPFTPVVSPTDDMPAHIDKMFLQTSSGYRPVEHCYYKHSFVGGGGHMMGANGGGNCGGAGDGDDGDGDGSARGSANKGTRIGGGGGGIAGFGRYRGRRGFGSYTDTHCLLDAEGRRRNRCGLRIEFACYIQRMWLLISNICHGLLAGLALAHLLFVLSNHPMEWSKMLTDLSLAGETLAQENTGGGMETTIMNDIGTGTSVETIDDTGPPGSLAGLGPKLASLLNPGPTESSALRQHLNDHTMTFIADYATFAEVYLNTFYCLAIICMVSVLDRMDICHWDFSNSNELISFRWLIIAMIYIATIILTICSNTIDEKLYFNNSGNVTLTQREMLSNSVISVWSSLSVTRSIGAICGWIMIGLSPHEDMLHEHLLDLAKYQMALN